MTINYNGRVFRGASNSDTGEVSAATVFVYRQQGTVLSGEYSGGEIAQGHLLGTVGVDGSLDFCYHHLNVHGEAMAGTCHSVPERDANGRLVLNESWRWFTGDGSSGSSVVVEIDPAG